MERLEEEIRTLREQAENVTNGAVHGPVTQFWKPLYRRDDGKVGLSPPLMAYKANEKNKMKLPIEQPLANPAHWPERQQNMAFVLCKEYSTISNTEEDPVAITDYADVMRPVEPIKQCIELISEPTKEAPKAFIKEYPKMSTHFPGH